MMNIRQRLAQYAPLRLRPDLSRLSDAERRMLPLLTEAAQAMDEPFWIQNYGDRQALLAAVADPDTRRYIELNYGPWDRLRANEPFIAGAGPKPAGANFYPPDMTREEFATRAAEQPRLLSPYTMVRRDEQGELIAIPYHTFFHNQVQAGAKKLRQAAALAEDAVLQTYLNLRAEALLSDDYRASDFAWMEMRANSLDILIGPMEIEDRLPGLKTAYAASILVKEQNWSERLRRYLKLLPRFQQNLPLPHTSQRRPHGLDSDLGVYDVVFYSGNDRAATPTGITWPEDEEVQLQKGTRSLLLKNALQARFEKNLLPLADLLLTREQRPHVTSEAHFTFVMLHELAHGLGIKETVTGQGWVKEALKEQYHAVEEGKADLLSLHMMGQLQQWRLVSEADLRDLYISSLVSLLYNWDAPQAAMHLNFFKEMGAYSREAATGRYRVHFDAMPQVVDLLAAKLLRIQAGGDYNGAKAFLARYGRPDEALQLDGRRIEAAEMPLGLALEYSPVT